ncbi:MAG: head GIN domain-containing protein [Lentimicrobium sp.]
MKTITAQKNFVMQLILLFVLAVTISLNALASKQERTVKNFNKFEVSGGFKVILTQGSTEKLVIDADDDVLPKIITEVKAGTLIIRLENNTHISNGKDLIAELTFINLDEIELSGAVNITGTNPMKFANLEIDGSGATKINLDLSATKLEIDFSGASEITLKGNAPEFDADLSGASSIEASEFLTRKCSIDCSGASDARVNVTESLSVEGSGASKISYTGNPANLDTELSGSSKINKF